MMGKFYMAKNPIWIDVERCAKFNNSCKNMACSTSIPTFLGSRNAVVISE